jgi:hypothetical protein
LVSPSPHTRPFTRRRLAFRDTQLRSPRQYREDSSYGRRIYRTHIKTGDEDIGRHHERRNEHRQHQKPLDKHCTQNKQFSLKTCNSNQTGIGIQIGIRLKPANLQKTCIVVTVFADQKLI